MSTSPANFTTLYTGWTPEPVKPYRSSWIIYEELLLASAEAERCDAALIGAVGDAYYATSEAYTAAWNKYMDLNREHYHAVRVETLALQHTDHAYDLASVERPA